MSGHTPSRSLTPLVGPAVRERAGDAEPPAVTQLLAVATLAVVAVGGAAAILWSGSSERDLGRIGLHLAVAVTPAVVGVYAARRTPAARFGHLLIATGLVWAVTMLGHTDESLPYSIGRLATSFIWPVLVYLMLSFPEGRLTARRDRALFRATLALVGVHVLYALTAEAYPIATPWASCSADCPTNAFMVPDSEPAFVDSFLSPLRDIGGALLLSAVSAALLLKVRSASRIRALTIAPVVVMSSFSLALVVAFLLTRRVLDDAEAARALGLAWALSLPAIAAAFCFGLLQRRLLIGNALSGLSLALSASPTPRDVGTAIRSTIGDPMVGVLTRDPLTGMWIGDEGQPADPDIMRARGLLVRTIGGDEPVAAVVVDRDVGTDDELIDAIVSLAETALREASLRSRLETSLHDLDESRKRIATAADAERRRIERNLHDGAQQRLIALRMRLALAEDMLRDDPVAASVTLHDLGDDIDDALDEIRSLARGIYPPLLADRGLGDALAGAARRLTLPVTVAATGVTRHSETVESAVYFSCLEALQNITKHATSATHARIDLHENHLLRFEVFDDGDGFDDEVVAPGRGLQNMRDRVESLGGSLSVLSSPGRGTLIRGEIPLGASGAAAEAAPVHGGAGQPDRQRQPVREEPVGERREHGVGR